MTTFLKSLKALSFSLLLLTLIFNSSPVKAGEDVLYNDGDTVLQGYWTASSCEKSATDTATPIVMIVHQWKGLGSYEKRRADMLADNCYHAFAIDMYGQGIRPESREEAAKQSGTYKNDPDLARKRLMAALSFAHEKTGKNNAPIGIIGYCFGGTMALELARSGADINAAVSFHGGLSSKAPATEKGAVKASVQVHHGAADPYVSAEEVKAFKDEMNTADADWHFISYADAVHAFTEKEAGNDPSSGVAYNEKADKRSWAYTMTFLEKQLKK